MKVLCIFPVTNNYDNIPEILKLWGKSIAPKLAELGANEQIDIKFAGTGYTYVPNNQSLEGQPKGTGIIECLKNVGEQPDIVMVCDGSNKIPYIHIVDIFQALISDKNVYCAMANRTGYKAISRPRFLIERFEVFLLKKYHCYAIDIPDGQCGLWGYRTCDKVVNGTVQRITLTAQAYDIELDLLGEVLEKKLQFLFVDIVLPSTQAQTQFNYQNNLDKMKFLIKKYVKMKFMIRGCLEEFEKTQEFQNLSSEKDVLTYWNDYKTDLLEL